MAKITKNDEAAEETYVTELKTKSDSKQAKNMKQRTKNCFGEFYPKN